jgi:hypothetical protein
MAQTSIDWFISEILKHDKSFVEFYGAEIEQAKEKNKEEIKKDFIAGMEFIPVDPSRYDEDAEQYYNETYRQIL